ncbi:uncharacterized protein K489DRAFT_207962 [Dissoconium aciculare CBS 342.82]|uniref:Uncharacterized protein n=1 Tax=Dissoconium aciculare CBS 342.82 TaxID=1314786 RepID=A0A6J3M6U6_9PEZI|nr:uncharacterized protein K489DRAFT_207962 [Dissoconium aciculare CBS 342.82]KAF1823791.1 hypothetical protein K489DRAFT_207962 [Dissoconium aciculare CBS 342.82]
MDVFFGRCVCGESRRECMCGTILLRYSILYRVEHQSSSGKLPTNPTWACILGNSRCEIAPTTIIRASAEKVLTPPTSAEQARSRAGGTSTANSCDTEHTQRPYGGRVGEDRRGDGNFSTNQFGKQKTKKNLFVYIVGQDCIRAEIDRLAVTGRCRYPLQTCAPPPMRAQFARSRRPCCCCCCPSRGRERRAAWRTVPFRACPPRARGKD